MFAHQDFFAISVEKSDWPVLTSDEDIGKLARCYWFSVEFGVCKEFDSEKEIKTYGCILRNFFPADDRHSKQFF